VKPSFGLWGKAAEGLVASYMRVISFNSVVPGVSSMVLMVLPAQHGKATQHVNDSLLCLLHGC
jgi:hypothetical protein